MLDQISGYTGTAMLTHKIHHHIGTKRAMVVVSALSKGRAREQLCLVLAIPGLGQPQRI